METAISGFTGQYTCCTSYMIRSSQVTAVNGALTLLVRQNVS